MIVRRVVIIVTLLVAALYLAFLAALFFMQERLLFPTAIAGGAGPLPPGAERLSIDTPDGVRLEGVHFPPLRGTGSGTLILSFPGNATNAQGMAGRLRATFPEHEIAAFHYRGYPPSGGSVAAAGMIEDAPLVYDLVRSRYRPQHIYAVGISFGSGIAATLAARRPLRGNPGHAVRFAEERGATALLVGARLIALPPRCRFRRRPARLASSNCPHRGGA
jgi:hypothetical protein